MEVLREKEENYDEMMVRIKRFGAFMSELKRIFWAAVLRILLKDSKATDFVQELQKKESFNLN